MNKIRRKALNEVLAKIKEASGQLESIMNDEEEYRDNMPENLQGSERYDIADAACDAMQEALENLEDAISNVESVQEWHKQTRLFDLFYILCIGQFTDVKARLDNINQNQQE